MDTRAKIVASIVTLIVLFLIVLAAGQLAGPHGGHAPHEVHHSGH